jgi:hypothetical protein
MRKQGNKPGWFKKASDQVVSNGDAFVKMEVLDPTLTEAPDWFKTSCGLLSDEVDLNDPRTYDHCYYKDWDCRQLRDEIYRKVGYVKLYVEQFHPGWCSNQVARIEQMLFWFGKEHRKYYQDTPEGRGWLRKWLFMFEDQTENMC